MHPYRRLAAGAALLALAFASSAADRIVIGESAPLTGSNAELGKDIRDGIPLAVLESKEVRFLEEPDPKEKWALQNALVQRNISPKLRKYLGKGVR